MLKRESRSSVNDGYVQLSRETDKQHTTQYKIVNISRGGLCFQSTDSFELNEVLCMNVTVDDTRILQNACGRVCYRNPQDKDSNANYGLSFLDKFIDADFVRSHK